MIVIGFDQAPRNIGWCFGGDGEGETPTWGLYQPGNYGEADDLLMRDVHAWARQRMKSAGAEAAYCEQIVINRRNINLPVLHAQFATCHAIMFAAAELGIPFFDVDIAAWRKRFLGRGNAPKHASNNTQWLKDMALRECASRNWLIDDHNVAEAVGIWEYGLACSSRRYAQRSKGDAVRRQLAQARKDMER